MSETIDERVVEMRFDNAQFERGVHTSLGTLEKLKKGLDLDSSAKSIENVGTAAKKLDFNPVSAGVDAIKTKFSALEVMAVTALANITNSAVNAGKRLVSALTIDPVKTGFQEYETQINAVQTILANTESKGSTLKDVNNALDELNTYADKTIYNFTEMTRNIGTFTAAGIDLETSTTAIKGIANLAAVSGSTSQQASTAMYQLSQALASGTVKLQDWNSVVNAGMGGQVFQDALKETARVHGIAIDQIIADEGSFRESLKNGWLSADILTETLEKFTLATDGLTEAQIEENRAMLKSKGYTDEQIDAIFKMGNTATDAATKVKTFTQLWDTLSEAAQSGWTSSWEIIVGDFEEAKELLTNVSNVVGDMIAKSADARNKVLQGWKDMGGRKALIDALSNAFKALMNVVTPIKEAFREIFPPITAAQLYKFTVNLRELTEKMKLNEEQSEKLKRIFKGLFSLIRGGIRVVKGICLALQPIADIVFSLVSKIFDAAASMGELATSFGNSLKESNSFNDGLKALSETAKAFSENISKTAGPVLGGFCKVLQTLWGFVKKIGSGLGKMFSGIWDSLTEAVSTDNPAKLLSIFNASMFSVLLFNAKKIAKKIGGAFSELFGKVDNILDGISGVLDSVRSSLQAWQQNLKADMLLKIAAAVGILALSLIALAGIKQEKLDIALKALTGIFTDMSIAMVAMKKLGRGSAGTLIAANALIMMSVSVRILASALMCISEIKPERLMNSIESIAALLGILTGAFKLASVGNPAKGAAQMVIMASAVKILGSVCSDLSALGWEDVAKGLVGVTALMGGLIGFSRAVKINKGMMSNAIAMIALAASLKILANVVGDFSAMNWEEIAKGCVAITALLGALAGFSNLMGKAQRLKSSAVVMFSLAICMRMLVSPMKEFAKMSWEDIAKGITALAASLLSMAGATRLMKPNDMLEASAVLPIMAASMTEMAKAFGEIGKLSWEDLAKGLIALGASIGAFALILKNFKGSFKEAASLVVVSTSLIILAGAIKLLGGDMMSSIIALATLAGTLFIMSKAMKAIKPVISVMFKFSGALATFSASLVAFGIGLAAAGTGLTIGLTAFLGVVMAFKNIGWAAIAKGVLVIAVAFTTLGVAAKLLKPVIPSILKLSGAVALFGLSCLSVGAAIALVVTTLSALAGMSEDAARSVARSLVVMITEFLDGIPKMVTSILRGLSAIATNVVKEFSKTAPIILEGVFQAFLNSAGVIRKYIPQIVSVLTDFICDILDEVIKIIPKLGSKVSEIVKALVETFTVSFSGRDIANTILAIKDISMAMLAFAAASKLISSISIAGAVKGVVGFSAVVAAMVGILTIMGGISKIPGVSDLISSGAELFGLMGKAIGAFIGCLITGIVDNLPKDVGQTVSAMASIVTIVLALAPVIKALSGIEADINNVVKGMVSIAAVIGGIAAVLAALGGLKQIPGFDWIISEGGDLLCKIAYILGEVVGSIVQGLADAITSSVDKVMSAILDVGAMIGAVAVIAKVVGKLKINPAAVAQGFAGIAIAIGCLEAILAALGGLAQIPGFNWIIEEGGKALCKLGSILGEFIGSIISGLGVGLTSGLPDIGDNLSRFMQNATPFITGAKNIDESVMKGVGALAEAILCLTAADIISSIASFITGGSSIAKFGEEIAEFGPCLKQFSDSVAGIDNRAVIAASSAGKALADMASTIPNEGGMVAWFTGENSVAKFGGEIASFGKDLSAFALSVSGINPQNVVAAAEAGKALADMASVIPNKGGIAAWFAGDNSVSKFGTEIADFGPNLKAFSDGVMGIIPANIVAAAEAGKALADMASIIPNEGGIAAWFAGENSVSKFGTEIADFGPCLKQFSDSVMGIVPQNVTAAAEAGKSLAEMVSVIPKEGGIQEWFGGKSSVSKFGTEIAGFGVHLRMFSNNVKGINPQNVTAAAEAGKSLAEMASNIPKEGGVKAWFAGESSISKFGVEIASFGVHIKSFSDNVKGISPENVTAAANAGKTLAELTNTLPSENGIAQWFGGEKSLAHFGDNVASFGASMKSFDDNVKGISPENVTAAAEAGKALAELTNTLPSENGIKQWFGGEKSLASFGDNVASFGASMKSFSDNVANIVPQNVTAAAEAGKALVELTNTVPTSGGIEAWFCGEKSLASFGDDIADFGKCIAEFSENVADIVPANVETAANAGKALVDLFNTIPEEVDVDDFGDAVITFGGTVKLFTDALNEIDVSYSIDQVEQILDMAEDIRKADLSGMNKLATSLANVADDGITKFISSFENAGDNAKRAITEFVENTVDTILSLKADFYDAGTTVTNRFITAADNLSGKAKASFATIADNCISGIKGRKNNFADSASTIIIGFISGVRDKEERVKAAFIGIISGSISSIRNKVGDFESAGTILIMGLISGILARSQKAESSFRDICGSCESILRSRQTNFYDIGRYFDEGMAKGISDYAGNVKEAASEMAKSALESAKKELDINSPSKKMYKIGSFAGAGFINALNDCGKRSEEAGREMAESVRHGISTSISRISDAIDDHIDYQPTIRPVLDLSDVEKNARGLDAIFSREQALSIGSPQRSERSRDESTSTSDPVASISFTQNNYSPKALSRMEIYRQTRNQISTLKGLVTNR